MIAKLWCFFFGHPRGKRVNAQQVQCPRCTATWDRPERKKAQ